MQLVNSPCILPPLKIGETIIDVPIFLAPLAGITDRSFRAICRQAGAGMVFTEMVSAEAIQRGSAKSLNLAAFQPGERPIGIQLFSHDPQALADAATRLEALNPDAFDLNFGCPVRKVMRRGAGAGFLKDINRLSVAIRAVVNATSKPVTVKLRSGAAANSITAIEAAGRAEDEGVAVITVHARTADQGFKGRANWDVIAQIKDAVNIPVVGNGDITSGEEMLAMLKQTGCDGVMIGRGTLGNPWIFAECRAALNDRPWQEPDWRQKWILVEEHLQRAFVEKGAHLGVREMRKHLGWYSKAIPGAAQFRAHVFRLDDPRAVLDVSREFFLNQRIPASTGGE